jgi:polysaccharide biosynthesis/export protein
MIRSGAVLSALAVLSLLGGCATSGPSPLAGGAAAYETIPEHADLGFQAEAIQPGDRLSVRVFGEPDISGDDFYVDSRGYIQVPLVGEVIAGGQSAHELSAELQRRLSLRFVRNASVTVAVTARPQSTFTVEGDVNAPGVFTATSSTTLLSALAQAKSPTKTAKTGDIIIFRNVNGQRTGGRFDLAAVRRGRAPDPQVVAGDTVVVVNSAAKSAWRDVLAALPVLNAFVLLK